MVVEANPRHGLEHVSRLVTVLEVDSPIAAEILSVCTRGEKDCRKRNTDAEGPRLRQTHLHTRFLRLSLRDDDIYLTQRERKRSVDLQNTKRRRAPMGATLQRPA